MRKEEIRSHIQDDESRFIFDCRVKYSESDGKDNKYIWKIVDTTPEGRKFKEIIKNTNNRAIFGAGLWGKELLKIWADYEYNCWRKLVDNNYANFNMPIDGITVESPSNIANDDYVFIITRLYYKEIKNQLEKNGLQSSHIINVGKMLDEMATRQYFDLSEMKKERDEVFVDVGAFDGKTSVNFMQWCDSVFKKIYCFEADSGNVEKCISTLSKVTRDYEVINKGAYSKECKLGFDNKGNGSSSISENASDFIYTTTIDKALSGEKVSFIKMDIEGSEMDALLGCEETIRNNRPKLAISIYHKLNDIIDIPSYILSINPDYKLYLRHYSLGSYETILYAL